MSDDAVPDTPLPAALRHPLRVAELPARRETRFSIVPGAKDLAAIAAAIGVTRLRKLRFDGSLRPLGRHDWELVADLGATVVQPCVVTLEPVTTRIDERVTRRYLAELEEPVDGEMEMPGDETAEPLRAVIDPAEVMVEALALALPLYPRADGAELGAAVFTEPGKRPMRDEDARPLAGLAALRDRLKDRK